MTGGKTMAECLFCKIRDGEVKGDIVYQDDDCIAFRDINPQAPTHLLIIPRKHIATMLDAGDADKPLLGHLQTVGARLAREGGYADQGFRMVMNCNAGAGQSVYHIHLHLLGGRLFRWPPG
jgi:histidine triad (HIT) family protein